MLPQNSIGRCWLPWRMYRIMSDGVVNFCCANPRPLGNVLTDDFEQIWNSSNAKDIRAKIAEGDYAGAGCTGCFFWGGHREEIMHWPDPSIPLTESQEFNHRAQKAEYFEGAAKLQSFPSVLFAQPSYTCNLHCVMCNQRKARAAGDAYVRSPSRLVEALFSFPVTPEMIILQGGEPLISGPVLRALSIVAEQGLQTLISLNTNGLLLHRHWRLLKSVPCLRLNVSIDAGDQQTYEAIRIGGSWERLCKNMQLIKESRPSGWKVNVHHVLMRRNISEVDKMLETHWHWCTQQRVFPIAGVDNYEENVFCYHFLLEDCPDWEEALQRAIHSAQQRCNRELLIELKYCWNLLHAPFQITREIYRALERNLSESERNSLLEELVRYRSDLVSGLETHWNPEERYSFLWR